MHTIEWLRRVQCTMECATRKSDRIFKRLSDLYAKYPSVKGGRHFCAVSRIRDTTYLPRSRMGWLKSSVEFPCGSLIAASPDEHARIFIVFRARVGKGRNNDAGGALLKFSLFNAGE